MALSFAAAELRADRDFVVEAVRRNWKALQFASVELRSDPGVCLEAVSQDWRAVGFFGTQEMRWQKELLIATLRGRWDLFEGAPEGMRADKDVALEACRQNGEAFRYASRALQ